MAFAFVAFGGWNVGLSSLAAPGCVCVCVGGWVDVVWQCVVNDARAVHVRGAATSPKRPKMAQTDPDRVRGTSLLVHDALWPIGRAWHAVGAPQRPAAHTPTPVSRSLSTAGITR